MPRLTLSEPSPYSPQQIFDLVADVAKYPEFLPWCKAARVHGASRLTEQARGGEAVGFGAVTAPSRQEEFFAELVIAFKGLTEKYTSRVTLHPDTYKIEVDMVEGPFHHLDNHWEMKPLPEGGTLICLDLDFRFKSRLLENLIGGLFQKASEKMVAAFRERADALYG